MEEMKLESFSIELAIPVQFYFRQIIFSQKGRGPFLGFKLATWWIKPVEEHYDYLTTYIDIF